MPTEPQPITISDLVRRAVAVCDASGVDSDLGELEARFEDADEPVGEPAVAAQRIAEGLGALDPQAEDGALQMAGAVATYLAYRRDQADTDPGRLIQLAYDSELADDPPPAVTSWLEESGLR